MYEILIADIFYLFYKTTLDFLSAQSQGGKIVHVSEARQFAKYSKNMVTNLL